MTQQKLNKLNLIIDNIGLYSIGIISMLYAMFMSDFAEVNLKLSFLDFPIFFGEIFIVFLSILAGIKIFYLWKAGQVSLNKWHYLLALYFGWIALQALLEYRTWGALSFRNAALFYYFIFAVFVCLFHKNFVFNQQVIYAALLVVTTTVIMQVFNTYFRLTFLIFFIILTLQLNKTWVKYTLLALSPLIFNLYAFFHDSRSHLLALSASIVFLIWYFAVTKIKRRLTKVACLLLLLTVAVAVIAKFGNKVALKSMTTPRNLIKTFKEYDRLIAVQKEDFKFKDLSVKLYNANRTIPVFDATKDFNVEDAWVKYKKGLMVSIREEIKGNFDAYEEEFQQFIKYNMEEMLDFMGESIEDNRDLLLDGQFEEARDRIIKSFQEEALKKMKPEGQIDHSVIVPHIEQVVYYSLEKSVFKPTEVAFMIRSLDEAYNNIIFRLMIWRDMIAEMKQKKAVFGVGLGSPQRSPSIEVLNWAEGEWLFTGWITPHNSFFHIIYRTGIVGLSLIVSFFVVFIFLIRKFMILKSTRGVLLCAVLVYWIILANFLVILELPYTAIPFWVLCGVTFSYFLKLDNEKMSNVNENTAHT